MRSASFALVLLLLRFDAGLSGDPLLSDDDDIRAADDCLRDACTYLVDACRNRVATSGSALYNCGDLLSDCFDRVYKKSAAAPAKRGSITRNSFLFMKLHPVLNKAVDPGLVNVPTRYRRIGGRLGSEFLGKRSGVESDIRKREADAAERRGRRAPSTELLGKRGYGSEMLGKRNVEMLGKRGVEFLGKRGSEFLGKRGSEFLGKRGSEFLGKRTCRTTSGDECYSPNARDPKLLVQYLKVAAGMDVGDQTVGSVPIERRLGSRSSQAPVYLLGKL